MVKDMKNNIKIKLPDKVAFIIHKLEENGYEAFAVGGCVRDTILGRHPNDWDITTSARPEQVKEIFNRTIDTGIAHGTVTVMLNHEGFEVTTYRVDGEYEDARHPKEVKFTPDLKEDLKRRDFTINAMAYNDSRGLVDEFGGADDIRNGIIKCVGDACERFNEDALRILRAVRFAAQLDFDICPDTREAVEKLAGNLTKISKERIQAELDKLLMSSHPEKFRMAYELGITKWIMPEFDKMMETEQNSIYHIYNVGDHTLKVMENIEKDHYLRWAALLHDVGKPECATTDDESKSHFYGHGDVGEKIAYDILKGLKFDNKTIKIVTRLVKFHDCQVRLTEPGVRKSIVNVGADIYPYLLKLKRADLSGKSEYSINETTKVLDKLEEIYDIVINRGDCLSISDMAVSGKDLIACGIERGEAVGKGLQLLFEEVLNNPDMNNRDKLMDIIKSFT